MSVGEGLKKNGKHMVAGGFKLFTAVALISFVLNLLVDNPYTHRFVRQKLDKILENTTEIALEFSAIKVSVMPPGVTLYAVKIYPRATPKFEWLSAVKLKAQVSLWAAILGDFRLSVVEANQLSVVWPMPFDFPGFLKSDDGEKNQPAAPESPMTWPPDFDLPLDRLVLVNSNVSVDIPIADQVPEPVETLYMTAAGISLDLAFRSWEKIKGSIKIDSFDLAIDSSVIVDDIMVQGNMATLSSTSLSLTDLKVDGPRVHYKGDGSVQLRVVDDILQDVDLKYAGQLLGDVSILGSFLELPKTHGGVSGEATVDVKIPVEAPGEVTFAVQGKGKLQDAYLDGYRLYDSSTEFKVNGDGLWLDNLHLIIGGQEYGRGKGHLLFSGVLPFEFETELLGTRLWDLLDAVSVKFPWADVALHAPKLIIKGQGDPFLIEASGNAVSSDILLPETPYDHSRYPVSPHCRLRMNVRVDLQHVGFDGSGGYCYQPRAATVDPLGSGELRAPAGAQFITPVTVEGGVDFEKGLSLKVVSDSMDLSVAHYFAQVPLKGSGPVVTTIAGPFDGVRIETDVKLSAVEVLGIELGKVEGQALIDGETVSWDHLKCRHEDGSQIHMNKGSLELNEEKTIRMEANLFNLSNRMSRRVITAFAPDYPFFFELNRGKISYRAPLLVPLAATGFLEAQLENLSYGDETLADSVSTHVILEPQRVYTKRLEVQKGSLDGSFDINLSRQALDAWILNQRPSVPYSWKYLSQKKKGQHAAGEVAHTPEPPDPRRTSPEKDSVENRLPQDWGLGLFHAYDFRMSLRERNPAQPGGLQSLPFAGDALRKAAIGGSVSMDAMLAGHMETGARGTFSLQVANLQLLGNPVPSVHAEGFIQKNQVEMLFNHSGRVVEGRLTFDLNRPEVPYELFINVDKFDLRFLAGDFFYSDPRNYIYWSGDLKLKGYFTDFLRSTGALRINDIRFSYVRDVGAQTRRILLRQDVPVTLLLQKNKWGFDGGKTLFLTGENLQMRVAMGENAPPEKLNIQVDSLLNLGLAREFFQGIDTAEGQLKASLKISGSVTDPTLRLDVVDAPSTPFNVGSWRPVTLGLADLRPAFRNIKLDVSYQNGKIFINNFLSDKGSGQVAARGSLALFGDGGEISRLGVSLNNATLIYPVAFLKSFETHVTGDLMISGAGLPYDVKGNIIVNRARSTKEVDIRDEIINTIRQRSIITAVSEDKPSVRLNIRVTGDQTIGVNNRNLQSVLSCDLLVTGTDTSPVVRGQIDVDKGKFIYKRDFQIVRGGITFDDPVKPDPNLDIVAVSDVENYRVFITISGRASNPSVEFSVDPPTRESGSQISKLEILILLSRGKLPNETRSLGGETEKAATSEAANLILGQFEEPVEKLFDLSGQKFLRSPYLDTQPGPEGNPVPRINVPLDLGENFDIVLRGDGTNNEMVAEYNIHNNITLNGAVERGQTGDEAASQAIKSDADAKFNLKFKFSFE